jgi:anti-sigma factor RsiW
MNCSHARLLLLFHGPGPSEYAAEDAAALRLHLEDCRECRDRAQLEEHADAALSEAMRNVPAPGGLEERILKRLRRERPSNPWPWLAGAAVLLLAVGISAVLYYRPVTPMLDHVVLEEAHSPGSRPEFVESWFRKQGVHMTMPPGFDAQYLDSWAVASVQGKRVAKLTYVRIGDGGAGHDTAVVHVYVFPKNAVRLDKSFAEKSGPVTLETSKDGDFTFLSIFTRGSRAAFPQLAG